MELSPDTVTPDFRVRAKNIDATLLGTRLKRARQRAGLTQGEAAADDMSTAYISRIEGGQRRPSPELLMRLATRLGCEADELLADDPQTVETDRAMRSHLDLDYAELELRTGQAAQALERLDTLLADDTLPGPVRLQARCLRAHALEALGELTQAVLVLEDLVADVDDGVLMLRVLIALSRCYREEGDLARACDIGDRADRLVDDSHLHGTAEGVQLAVTVAAAYFERGDVNHAVRLCQRAVESAEQLESATARASAYWNSSIMRSHQGDVRSALTLATKALALLEVGEDARNLARLRMQLGFLQLRLEPPETQAALDNLHRSRDELVYTQASEVDRGRVELGIARARLLIGETEEANQLAEDCYQRTRDTAGLLAAEARVVQGQVAGAQGRIDDAIGCFRDAILVLSAVGSDRGAAQLWFELGGLLHQHGQVDEALDAYRRAGASTGLRTTATEPVRRTQSI